MTDPTIGHNSAPDKTALKSLIDRIEHLEDEKKAIAADIRDIYKEAKGRGLDTKAICAIVKLRREDTDKRREREAILETYMHALGMLAGTPLAAAAIRRDGLMEVRDA